MINANGEELISEFEILISEFRRLEDGAFNAEDMR